MAYSHSLCRISNLILSRGYNNSVQPRLLVLPELWRPLQLTPIFQASRNIATVDFSCLAATICADYRILYESVFVFWSSGHKV